MLTLNGTKKEQGKGGMLGGQHKDMSYHDARLGIVATCIVKPEENDMFEQSVLTPGIS